MVLSKFHAAYGREGVLFFAVSPGVVDNSVDKPSTLLPSDSTARKQGLTLLQ